MSKHQFQTEVNQLLHLIVHSLYTHRDIFLRELISNASDALDKLKYLTITDDAFKDFAFEPRIDIYFDEKDAGTITVSDSGIGMNEQELVENLGTIARSGTRNFLAQLSGDSRKDSSLIGQFGVGFYSSFMVADKVEVISRKAGEEQAWKWTSDGKGEFEIEQSSRDTNGTTVTLQLADEGKEFATRWRIDEIVKKYSDHIAFPIYLHYTRTEYDDKGGEKGKEAKVEQVNSASALWKRPKSDLSEEDYKEFYKTIAHEDEDPLLYTHTQAEGTLEYTTLFYVPRHAPFDMYNVDYRPGVKLYIKRVFITDDQKDLMPAYLRFVRGIIDSEDLPLNVSRETLQHNRVLANIRQAGVKKLLGEFQRLATEDPERYTQFIEQYNRPLKEGLYSDFGNREALLELVRFKSSNVEGYTSLAEYKQRMLPDQKSIYYTSGDNENALRNSPLLEAYRKKNIEVLIMDDDIDEIVVPSIGSYKDTELKAINRSDAGEDIAGENDKAKTDDARPIAEKIKQALGDRVKDVKVSVRLSDSPSCIVVDENDPTIKMQQLLKSLGQGEVPEVKPILEINPDHRIVTALADISDQAMIDDVSFLLLEQALLVENVPITDPAAFVKRLNRVLEKAV
ncbi:MAG: molecular chaperone HtpG [Spirochaetaceae bacterium]|nr:MAG: molecular chaperone HtpG [Spirochaetaceae bacterium]